MTKQKERRRRQRQRRREQKEQKAQQQNGSEQPIDEELATQMHDWAVHEPRQTNIKEPGDMEQVDTIQQTLNSILESIENDFIDSGPAKA